MDHVRTPIERRLATAAENLAGTELYAPRPISVDARGARQLFGLGPTKLRELRRSGRLHTTKLGHRTLLYLVEELEQIVGATSHRDVA